MEDELAQAFRTRMRFFVMAVLLSASNPGAVCRAAARTASLRGASDFLADFVVLARAALGGFPSEDLLMAGPFSE